MTMHLSLDLGKLRMTTPVQYLSRFVFGGLVTVVATLIANHFGPVVGGLFLAFPGILPPGLTLTEKHVIEKKARAGKRGTRFGRAEASLEAAGASAGSLGLIAFGFALWKGMSVYPLLPSLSIAFGAWLIVSFSAWWVRKRI
jgi:hypothetical protein